MNKTPVLKNCLGGLLPRLIQVLDTACILGAPQTIILAYTL